MTTSDQIQRLQAAFKDIRIEHPRLQAAHVRLDEMRHVGLKTRGKPQKILPIIGPSGSGKTTIFDSWSDKVYLQTSAAGSANRVLRVTLSAKATVRQLGIDILQALGPCGLPVQVIDDLVGRQANARVRTTDPLANLRQPQIIFAATAALRNAQIELLCIDEIHHLVDSDGKTKVAWSVSETLKVMADSGICPIVVIGTYAARRIISNDNNPQFARRCTYPIALDPLDLALQDEIILFAGYVSAIAEAMHAMKIFDTKQNLRRSNFLECFYDVSGGVIGTVSHLIEFAAEFAIRRGATSIEREDLSMATSRWAMAHGITDYNPWEDGPRDRKIARKRVS